MWSGGDGSVEDRHYSSKLTLDLTQVEPCMAGPRRPEDLTDMLNPRHRFKTLTLNYNCEDLVPLASVKDKFQKSLTAELGPRGYGLSSSSSVTAAGHVHGVIGIAAITSCTNTSNPSLMISAGLLAQNAVKFGLTVPLHVKTSLAPGSRVVGDYLKAAGLISPLEQLGFHTAAHGCTTCMGMSGDLTNDIAEAYDQGVVVCAVLSGNRNFEGRIHPQV